MPHLRDVRRCAAIAIALIAIGCHRPPVNVSVRVTGGDACLPSITLVTTPRIGSGEPSMERQSHTPLPYEASRSITTGTSMDLMINGYHCNHIECALLVDGREVSRAQGTPIPDDGLTAHCEWRAP